ARELLAQMQNMLENLRAARPGQQQRGNNQAQQMMRGLQDLMQRQQQLLDKSFRAQRQQGQQGQPGQQDRSRQPGQPGDQQESAEQGGELGDEAGEQEGLRHSLGDLMRRLGEGMGDIPDPFGRAERAMRDATGALQKSRQILDELRRRAGERSRPLIELDYIERLLKRF